MQRYSRLALRDDLYGSLRSLTLEVLVGGEPTESPQEKIAYWESTNASRLGRARSALAEISESGTLDLATLSVAAVLGVELITGALFEHSMVKVSVSFNAGEPLSVTITGTVQVSTAAGHVQLTTPVAATTDGLKLQVSVPRL